MAEPTHLAILEQGIESWNTWRKDHPDIQPDLSDADLSDQNLIDLDFRKTNLSGAKLQYSRLGGTRFQQANLSRSNLTRTESSSTEFHGANLYQAQLEDCYFEFGNFTNANLQETNLHKAHFAEMNLEGANLQRANLSEANMRKCSFRHANLQQAHLSFGQFCESSFIHANLMKTNLVNSDFSYVLLEETLCDNAMMGWTLLHNIDLHQMQGLESVKHIGPSEVNIPTLYRCHKDLPEMFLRHAGVSESLLAIFKQSPEFLSPSRRCFLAYFKEDRVFAKQLQKDLQEEGIRCWLTQIQQEMNDDPWEDFSLFDFFSSQTGAPTGSYMSYFDQIILLLSMDSIGTDNTPIVLSNNQSTITWTIRTALEKEDSDQHPVLFPLQLDRDIAKTEFIKKYVPSTHSLYDFSEHSNKQRYLDMVNTLAHALQQ